MPTFAYLGLFFCSWILIEIKKKHMQKLYASKVNQFFYLEKKSPKILKKIEILSSC